MRGSENLHICVTSLINIPLGFLRIVRQVRARKYSIFVKSKYWKKIPQKYCKKETCSLYSNQTYLFSYMFVVFFVVSFVLCPVSFVMCCLSFVCFEKSKSLRNLMSPEYMRTINPIEFHQRLNRIKKKSLFVKWQDILHFFSI